MNDDVPSKVRTVAAAVQQQVGRQERIRLGMLTERDAARFHVTVQGAVRGVERESPGIHPLLLSAILAWGDGPAEPDLLADGNSKDVFVDADLGGLRLMGGGQDLTFHKPIDTSTEYWMHVGIDSVEVKSGRSGEFIALRIVREYRDAEGELYTACRETFLAR